MNIRKTCFRNREFFVYIASNFRKTLYVGVTSDLTRRVSQHKSRLAPGFSARYNTHRLVCYEQAPNPLSAIAREKQIKGWRRDRKIQLIESSNPGWTDLAAIEGLTRRKILRLRSE